MRSRTTDSDILTRVFATARKRIPLTSAATPAGRRRQVVTWPFEILAIGQWPQNPSYQPIKTDHGVLFSYVLLSPARPSSSSWFGSEQSEANSEAEYEHKLFWKVFLRFHLNWKEMCHRPPWRKMWSEVLVRSAREHANDFLPYRPYQHYHQKVSTTTDYVASQLPTSYGSKR